MRATRRSPWTTDNGLRALRVLIAGLAFAFAPLAHGGPAAATAPDAGRGLEVAREMKARDRGYGSSTATLQMVLIDAGGGETVRQLRTRALEGNGDGDRLLAVFDAPADVRGTVFLNHTHGERADDQWLYLPALKRVKRIASANRTSPFMGSELSYEDLAAFEVEKYRYRYRGEETFNGVPSVVIERIPVDADSGYSRELVWVDRARYVPLKIEFYDRRGAQLKTLVAGPYRQFLGRYWRALEARMTNHQSGRSTVLRWSDIRFGQDLDEQDFLPASMARAR